MLNGGQKSVELDGSARAEVNLVRRYAISVGWKVVLVIVVDFVLLRIWAPDLINLHQNLALAGAVLCVLIALAATIWLGFQLWIDVKRFSRSRRVIPRTRPF